MKRRVLFMVVAVALLAVVGGTSVFAQNVTIVNVPFKFTFNNRVMDPGRYEVTVSSEGIVTLMPPKGESVLGASITRLAQPVTPLSAPTFVFDKIGEQYSLAEMWLPMEDGYVLATTKQPHQHHTIKGSRKG